MAIAFVRASVAGRSGGKNAVAMAAYRSGEKIKDEATGKIYDYTKKRGVEHSEILTPIAATPGNEWLIDRAQLWNRVEVREKPYNAQLAREITIAIPRELNRTDSIELVREYVQSSFVDRGMIADINIHNLDSNNPHAHVMITMRHLKVDDRGVASFGNKNRAWNDRRLYREQKLEWDKIANQYLECIGAKPSLDSRSYEEQGIDKLPQVHLGASVAMMQFKNIPTDLGSEYDRIEWINNNIAAHFEEIYQMPIELPLSDYAQERIDRDLLRVAADYPALRGDPDYLAAVARSKARYQEHIRTMSPPEEIDFSFLDPVEPVKWQPTLEQPANPQLVESLLTMSQALGNSEYQAGNYRVRILEKQIEIEYKDAPVMSISLNGEPVSSLIDQTHTINQFERGLGASIDTLLSALELQRQQQQLAQEQERQRQRQLELQRQQEIEEQEREKLEAENSITVVFDIEPDPKDPVRYRQRDFNISR